MNKALFYICSIILISLVSCEKSTDDPTTKTSFVISKENETDFNNGIKFDCNGWEKIVKFSTNKSWHVTTDNSSWISVSPDEGEAGDIQLYITVYPNDSYSDREDTITIISDDVTKIIKVTQDQKNELKVYTDEYEVDAEGGPITVDIYSNINYKTEIAEIYDDWIFQSITPNPVTSKSLTLWILGLYINKNESYKSREAEIYIKSETITRTVKIKQNGQIA